MHKYETNKFVKLGKQIFKLFSDNNSFKFLSFLTKINKSIKIYV